MKKAKKNKSFVAHWGIGYRGKGSVSPKTFLKLVFSFFGQSKQLELSNP
jgi:hypothetical protein